MDLKAKTIHYNLLWSLQGHDLNKGFFNILCTRKLEKTNTVDAKELLLVLKQEFLNYIRMAE